MNRLQSIINLLSLQEEDNACFLSENTFIIATEEYKITIKADEENITAEIQFSIVIPDEMIEDVSLRLAMKNTTIAASGFSINENRICKKYWFSALEDTLTIAFCIDLFLQDIARFSRIIKSED